MPTISIELIKKFKCSPQVIAPFAFWPLGAATFVSTARWLPENKW